MTTIFINELRINPLVVSNEYEIYNEYLYHRLDTEGLYDQLNKIREKKKNIHKQLHETVVTKEGKFSYHLHPGAMMNCTNSNHSSSSSSTISTNSTAINQEKSKNINDNNAVDNDGSIGIAIISCRQVPYRLPIQSFHHYATSKTEHHNMITIILSSSKHRGKRNTIRSTWAKEQIGIYFIVSGDWNDVHDEFMEYNDIIWVGVEEIFENLTYKTFASFTIMERMLQLIPGMEYDFILKTDDDSYVDLDSLKRMMSIQQPDYWGGCKFNDLSVIKDPNDEKYARFYMSDEEYPYDTYPPYCLGGGVVLSRAFIDCAVLGGHVSTIKYMKWEDTAVGLLANRCHVEIDEASPVVRQHFVRDSISMSRKVIQHHVPDKVTMLRIHDKFQKSMKP